MKDEVNFKVFDAKTWEINNRNTNIAQYLKKLRQLDNEIWSLNDTHMEELVLCLYFSTKIH